MARGTSFFEAVVRILIEGDQLDDILTCAHVACSELTSSTNSFVIDMLNDSSRTIGYSSSFFSRFYHLQFCFACESHVLRGLFSFFVRILSVLFLSLFSFSRLFSKRRGTRHTRRIVLTAADVVSRVDTVFSTPNELSVARCIARGVDVKNAPRRRHCCCCCCCEGLSVVT